VYHVGLNAHLLSLTKTYRGAGINGHIYQLLRHLPEAERATTTEVAAQGTSLQFTAYLHDPTFVPPEGMAVCRARWDTRRPWRRIIWEQTRLAGLTRRLDLLHGLAFAAPLAATCPTVITVHDLSFIRFPELFRPFNRYYLTLVTRAAARRAACVIAVSESTRQDVIALCGVPGERVVVVPNGVTEAFCPAAPAAVAEFRRRKGLPERFILFLGTLEPRKNLLRLIDAYALWRHTSGTDVGAAPCRRSPSGGAYPLADQPADTLPPVKLVIAGAKGWFYEQIFARVADLGLADDVLFPGFVPEEELPWWYGAAGLFVYPSLFEGFGLPVLEALACGTPVITSTASSLPEVAGDAALLVDPEDTAALADAIGRLLAEPALAARLREAGPRQAARFSWPGTAAATIAVYRDILDRSTRRVGA
jgi:glycosyltransferase involved in cell wall biosynthesis